jgi:type IV pilus biogenesis protein CpaD/CtpE
MDHHTLMVRRRVAAGVAVVVLIVIVLVINGCLKSQKTQALKDYNRHVNAIAAESDSQVSRPLFAALAGASGKSALDVEVQIDQLRIAAQTVAANAKKLSTPGEMTAAQRDLLLALDLRVEGMTKVAALVPTALGSKNKQASTLLAGDMEIFLASDVIYSQRVVPLISESLAANGVHGLSTTPTRFLANIGWLDPNTTFSRLTGQATGATGSQTVTGNHGSALKVVSVGTNTLAPESTLNHVSGGSNPTFTVQVENSGEFPETNVKVDITVTAGGKQYKASHVIEKTEPGKTVNVEIPVTGIPLGAAAKVQVNIEGVPGENDLENNKGTFLAIFGA